MFITYDLILSHKKIELFTLCCIRIVMSLEIAAEFMSSKQFVCLARMPVLLCESFLIHIKYSNCFILKVQPPLWPV